MTLTLVRHAEVVEEFQGKYNGHLDISLSCKGKEDAIKLGETLKEKHFDLIYCSDLLRAKETLSLCKRAEKQIFTSKLREKSWGKHEGMSFEAIEKTGIKYENFTQWIDALDGEKKEPYIARIKNFFETLKQKKETNLLIVTHSGVIKTLLHITQGISLEEAFTTQLEYTQSLELELK